MLFYGALWVLHTAGVELDFFHRAAIIAFWAGAVLYFYWALGRRQFIYAWDYVNYIQKQFNTEAAFALGPVAGFKSVSYTHLDVYKRQVQNDMDELVLQPAGQLIDILIVGIKGGFVHLGQCAQAVSYTHLDVYKRQSIPRRPGR